MAHNPRNPVVHLAVGDPQVLLVFVAGIAAGQAAARWWRCGPVELAGEQLPVVTALEAEDTWADQLPPGYERPAGVPDGAATLVVELARAHTQAIGADVAASPRRVRWQAAAGTGDEPRVVASGDLELEPRLPAPTPPPE